MGETHARGESEWVVDRQFFVHGHMCLLVLLYLNYYFIIFVFILFVLLS